MTPILQTVDFSVSLFSPNAIVKIVESVSISLYKGQVFGILGGSGCGKTITCLALMGYVLPPFGETSGMVVFNELPTVFSRDMKGPAYSGKGVYMLFQNPRSSLNPVRNIGYQMLEMVCIHRKDIVSRREKLLELEKTLVEVGFDNPRAVLKAYPHEISQGQCQLICISMGLLAMPAVLIADEPTSSLDPTTRNYILNVLRQISEKNQIAVLMTSHDIGAVYKTCDQVGVFFNGRLVETGPAKAVLEYPNHSYTKKLLASYKRPLEQVNYLW